MPTNITPVNEFDATTALTRPAPGERVGMETGAAPLAPLLQRLIDRDETLRLGLLGQMAGGDRMSVDPGGTSTVFTVRVSRIRSALIKDTVDGVWRGVSLKAQTLGLSATAGPLAALAADTWYYVTLAVESGTPRLYINVFGPDDSLVWEAGMQDTFRYIGCFRTNGSGAPIPMRMHRGRYVYQTKQTIASALSTAGVWAAQSLSVRVPPHVEMVTINVQSSRASNTGTRAYSLRPGGASASVFDCSALQHNQFGDIEEMRVEMLCDSGQNIEYQTNDTTSLLEIGVAGFAE